MEIPLTGLMVEHHDPDSHHSHKLYITSWDGRPVHTHPFSGVTSFDYGHHHEYASMTEPAASGVQHVHGYYTVTSFSAGHTHVIRGVTGPAIPLTGGGHYHYFEGFTSVNGSTPHAHRYKGSTGNEISDF